jgi:hypothetical protein
MRKCKKAVPETKTLKQLKETTMDHPNGMVLRVPKLLSAVAS